MKTYGDSLQEYEFHPESKCADSGGVVSKRKTVGLPQRRHVRIDHIVPIGKESNNLEGVEAGVVHSEQDLYINYPDPRQDERVANYVPALRKPPIPLLVKESGLSRRTIIELRVGRSKPHEKNETILVFVLHKLGLVDRR